MEPMRTVIRGCGSYLPERTIDNEELSAKVETSDEWIVERTGIRYRHVAAEGEFTSDLAYAAADRALDNTEMAADEIDLIVLATSTPDETFPATATTVQARLGIHHGAAFDVQAVCSGFIYALAVVDNFIKTGQSKNALVIGAETFSRILDWEDRGTCVLFGDGAGAVVVSGNKSNGSAEDRGVLSTHLHADGRHHDLLYVDGGPSSTGDVGFLRMEGKEVFRHAVVKMAEVTVEALETNDLQASDIDWFVPHQANKRIIVGTAKKLGINLDRVVVTINKHANTSAASIPLALWVASGDNRIKRDDLVLIEALGGGMTWGSGLVRW